MINTLAGPSLLITENMADSLNIWQCVATNEIDISAGTEGVLEIRFNFTGTCFFQNNFIYRFVVVENSARVYLVSCGNGRLFSVGSQQQQLPVVYNI